MYLSDFDIAVGKIKSLKIKSLSKDYFFALFLYVLPAINELLNSTKPTNTYSTRQKYSAPSTRRRRRAQVNNIDLKFVNIFISHCQSTCVPVFGKV